MKSVSASLPSTAAILALLGLLLSEPARAQGAEHAGGCDMPVATPGALGPIDYRRATPQDRTVVESHHFTPGVESMTKPLTSDMQNMASDVAYTLEVFPNHHRALLTMWRLSKRDGKNPANSGRRTVECWFERAIRYASDDPIPRLLLAQYLIEKKRKDEALALADSVLPLAQDNAFTHYNLGLTYFDLGAFDKAAQRALAARELGMPREDLINKLKQAGKWDESALTDGAKPPGSN